jgi:hypothetical protein
MTMFLLEMRIERNDELESFDPTWGGIVAHPRPRYRVTATVLDTEQDRFISYEFRSMIVPSSVDFEDIGRIVVNPTHEQVEKLRQLRDELDEILGDGDD